MLPKGTTYAIVEAVLSDVYERYRDEEDGILYLNYSNL
jgi:hypothetical protein